MSPQTQPRVTYRRDIEHIRRIAEALEQDQTADPKIRTVLGLCCDMLHVGLGMIKDTATATPVLQKKTQEILAVFASLSPTIPVPAQAATNGKVIEPK